MSEPATCGLFRLLTDDILCVRCSPDGTFVVTTSRDNTAIVWSLIDFKQLQVLTGHGKDVLSCQVSDRYIITTSEDTTAIVWQSRSGVDQGVPDQDHSASGSSLWVRFTQLHSHTDDVLAGLFTGDKHVRRLDPNLLPGVQMV